MSQILFLKWVGKAKILRNIQGGLDEMLIIAYIVGGWVQKSQKSAYVIYGRSLRQNGGREGGSKNPKKCLRNIWTVPKVE